MSHPRFQLHCHALLLALCPLGWAHAESLQPILPPTEIAQRVLAEHPAVQAGQAGLDAANAERRKLTSGPYEWTVRTQQQRRRTVSVDQGDARYQEWNIALERPLRLPGKAHVDETLGALAESSAHTAAEDARHEAARELLKRWFDWLRENTLEKQWTAQSENLNRQHQAIVRRVQLGDAAKIEQIQMAAARAHAEAQLAAARENRQRAELLLRQQYPGLPLTLPKQLPSPQPPEQTAETLIEDILAHNHELALAIASTRQAELIAARSQQDRLPDPTFGIQVGSERAGEERLLAAYLSWPIPGTGRAAMADSSQAQANMSRLKTAALRRRITAETSALVLAAQQAVVRWQMAQQAAGHQDQVADMARLSWTLGEGSLNELLLAVKLANEARLSAQTQQLDALELGARLQLEQHRLWP